MSSAKQRWRGTIRIRDKWPAVVENKQRGRDTRRKIQVVEGFQTTNLLLCKFTLDPNSNMNVYTSIQTRAHISIYTSYMSGWKQNTNWVFTSGVNGTDLFSIWGGGVQYMSACWCVWVHFHVGMRIASFILKNFRNSPQACLLLSQSPDQHANKHLLTVLHLERMACSTLKKNGKRNSKVDGEMGKEVLASGNFRLGNVTGKETGLTPDILAELARRGFMHLLANILTKLSGMDLINLSKVSRIWKILESGKGVLQQYSKVTRVTESSKLSLHASTRGYAVGSTALTSVQKSSTWAPPRKDVLVKPSSLCGQKGSAYSGHNEFLEVSKTLKKQRKSQSLCSL